MSEFDAQAPARELFRARMTRSPCQPLASKYAITDLARAQAVQAALLALYARAGQERIGFKIGLTDQAVQTATGIGHPLSGVLLQGTQYWHGDDIPVASLLQPKAEAEVAFVMSRTVDDPDTSIADLLDAIGGALPALEICDSAIQGWPRSLPEALADNLCCGFIVIGSKPVDPRSMDFPGLAMALWQNRQRVAEGSGSQCMGNPLHALQWLARDRALAGEPLQAGDIVMSGALGPMQAITRGDSLRMELGALGVVECRFV